MKMIYANIHSILFCAQLRTPFPVGPTVLTVPTVQLPTAVVLRETSFIFPLHWTSFFFFPIRLI